MLAENDETKYHNISFIIYLWIYTARATPLEFGIEITVGIENKTWTEKGNIGVETLVL